MLKLDHSKQVEIVEHVTDTFSIYKDLLFAWKDRMVKVDEAIKTFTYDKKHAWSTSFKVNKCHEIENKVVPRIISNNPTWIVSPATDEFDVGDIDLPVEEKIKKQQQYDEYALAIRDYLSYLFEKYDTREIVKLGAKALVRY